MNKNLVRVTIVNAFEADKNFIEYYDIDFESVTNKQRQEIEQFYTINTQFVTDNYAIFVYSFYGKEHNSNILYNCFNREYMKIHRTVIIDTVEVSIHDIDKILVYKELK